MHKQSDRMISNILYKSVFWRGIYVLSVLLLNLIISRHFGAGISGMIFYSITIYSFIMLLLSISLEAGMGYNLSSDNLKPAQLGLISICWTFLITVLMVLSYPLWEKQLGTYFTTNEELIFSIFFISGNLIITYFVALFHAKLNFKIPYVVLIIVQLLLITAFLVSEIKRFQITDKTLISIYFVTFPISAVLLISLFFKRYGKQSELVMPTNQQLRALFQFSINAFIINLLTFLLKRVDLAIVEYFCKAESLGNYIQVNKLSQMFYLLPVMLASALFPMTAGGMQSEVKEKLQQLCRLIVASYLLIGMLIALSGFWLFPILLGKSFDEMYFPMLIAFPGIIAYSLAHLFAAYFSGRNMLFVNFKGISICLFLLILLDVLLIPRGGILMAAMVSSIASICYFAYLFWYYRKEHIMSLNSFLYFRKDDFRNLLSWIQH